MSYIPIIVTERMLFGRATWWQKFLALVVGIIVTYGLIMLFGMTIITNLWIFFLACSIPALICFYYEVELWYIVGLFLGMIIFITHILLALFNFVLFPFPIFY